MRAENIAGLLVAADLGSMLIFLCIDDDKVSDSLCNGKEQTNQRSRVCLFVDIFAELI